MTLPGRGILVASATKVLDDHTITFGQGLKRESFRLKRESFWLKRESFRLKLESRKIKLESFQLKRESFRLKVTDSHQKRTFAF